jgi:hypothetical protein
MQFQKEPQKDVTKEQPKETANGPTNRLCAGSGLDIQDIYSTYALNVRQTLYAPPKNVANPPAMQRVFIQSKL